MHLTCIFWNLQKKPVLAEHLRELCRLHAPEIFVLTECPLPVAALLRQLNTPDAPAFSDSHNNGASRIRFFTRLGEKRFLPAADLNSYISVRQLAPSDGDSGLLVAGVHLPSKRELKPEEQHGLALRYAGLLSEVRKRHPSTPMVIAGDFNMNPFEHGVCSSEGFHGVMSRQIALPGKRKVLGVERELFYNPMWSLLGDDSPGPPGTCFYRGGVISYFWNMFDQVLYSSAVLARFTPGDVEVLTACGETSLLARDGRPDAKRFSDHLPVRFVVRT